MKTIVYFFFISAMLFTSCKKEEQKSTAPTNVVPFTQITQPTTTTPVANQSVLTTQTQQNTSVLNENKTTSTSPPATTAKGMNPAHGQPLHRCDIPVGAPLNSPINKQQKTTPQTKTIPTPVAAINPTSVVTTPTPEGMNPPHGQTGHRCDIAVGAALPKE